MNSIKKTLAGASAAAALFGAAAVEAQTTPAPVTPVAGGVIDNSSVIEGAAAGTLVIGSDVQGAAIGANNNLTSEGAFYNSYDSIGSLTAPAAGGFVQSTNGNIAGGVAGTAVAGSFLNDFAVGSGNQLAAGSTVNKATTLLGGVNGANADLGFVSANASIIGGSADATGFIGSVGIAGAAGSNNGVKADNMFSNNAVTVGPSTYSITGLTSLTNTTVGAGASGTAAVGSILQAGIVGTGDVVVANAPVFKGTIVINTPAP